METIIINNLLYSHAHSIYHDIDCFSGWRNYVLNLQKKLDDQKYQHTKNGYKMRHT